MRSPTVELDLIRSVLAWARGDYGSKAIEGALFAHNDRVIDLLIRVFRRDGAPAFSIEVRDEPAAMHIPYRLRRGPTTLPYLGVLWGGDWKDSSGRLKTASSRKKSLGALAALHHEAADAGVRGARLVAELLEKSQAELIDAVSETSAKEQRAVFVVDGTPIHEMPGAAHFWEQQDRAGAAEKVKNRKRLCFGCGEVKLPAAEYTDFKGMVLTSTNVESSQHDTHTEGTPPLLCADCDHLFAASLNWLTSQGRGAPIRHCLWQSGERIVWWSGDPSMTRLGAQIISGSTAADDEGDVVDGVDRQEWDEDVDLGSLTRSDLSPLDAAIRSAESGINHASDTDNTWSFFTVRSNQARGHILDGGVLDGDELVKRARVWAALTRPLSPKARFSPSIERLARLGAVGKDDPLVLDVLESVLAFVTGRPGLVPEEAANRAVRRVILASNPSWCEDEAALLRVINYINHERGGVTVTEANENLRAHQSWRLGAALAIANRLDQEQQRISHVPRNESVAERFMNMACYEPVALMRELGERTVRTVPAEREKWKVTGYLREALHAEVATISESGDLPPTFSGADQARVVMGFMTRTHELKNEIQQAWDEASERKAAKGAAQAAEDRDTDKSEED